MCSSADKRGEDEFVCVEKGVCVGIIDDDDDEDDEEEEEDEEVIDKGGG